MMLAMHAPVEDAYVLYRVRLEHLRHDGHDFVRIGACAQHVWVSSAEGRRVQCDATRRWHEGYLCGQQHTPFRGAAVTALNCTGSFRWWK